MFNRRSMMVAGLVTVLPHPAWAAGAAEDFVQGSIRGGLAILNDKTLAEGERRKRFADFLLGIVDLRRVAIFLLGKYAATAAPADVDAFVAEFRDYMLAVYQSYFARYAGQTLVVAGSQERAPGDVIVHTSMTGGDAPVQVDFRVRTDGPKPVLVDVCVEGLWLALAQRDEYAAVLSQGKGDVTVLTAHLKDAEQRYR